MHRPCFAKLLLLVADARACCWAAQDRVKLRQLAESERREAKERAVQEALEDAQTNSEKEPGPGARC